MFDHGGRDEDVESEPHSNDVVADYANPREDEDPDSVDTTPIPYGVLTEVETDAGAGADESPVLEEEPEVPEAPVSDGGVPDRPDESQSLGEAVPDTSYPTSGGAAGEPSSAGESSGPDIVVPDTGPPAPKPPRARSGRHAAADDDDDDEYALSDGHEPALNPVSEPATASAAGPTAAVRPTIHLPLEDDPYRPPNGYPIKASARFGLYYTPSSPLYHDTLAELWFISEEAARANGFVRAD